MDAHKIPPQLVINWDQAGVNWFHRPTWILKQEGVERVEISGLNDKHQALTNYASIILGIIGSPKH